MNIQRVYNVFNLDQTNLCEARPEMYQKFLDETTEQKERTTEGMVEFPSIDAMIAKDLWVCPIRPTYGNDAYYSISKDEIVIPEKAQFKDGESFYSNLLHEMAHSTGSESRLNRLKPSSFGSAEYGKEELTAELTAALVASQHGMAKNIKEDSASYLKSWLQSLQQDPEYIKTVLLDVKRSASFISNRIEAVSQRLDRDGWNADFTDIRQQNKSDGIMFNEDRTMTGPTSKTSDLAPQTLDLTETKGKNVENGESMVQSDNQPRFRR